MLKLIPSLATSKYITARPQKKGTLITWPIIHIAVKRAHGNMVKPTWAWVLSDGRKAQSFFNIIVREINLIQLTEERVNWFVIEYYVEELFLNTCKEFSITLWGLCFRIKTKHIFAHSSALPYCAQIIQ